MEKVQEAADWVTINVRPAIVIVPVRLLLLLFDDTVKPTTPLPVPLLPEVMVIKAALLSAPQLQPSPVVTATVPVPPAAVKVCLVGESRKLQSPACETVKVCPAMVKVPVRAMPVVLGTTEKSTVPLPVPLVPAVIVIKDALLAAVHGHPSLVVTVTFPMPPLDGMV
jgi:hypothetical protein